MKYFKKTQALILFLFYFSGQSQGLWTQKANVDTFFIQQAVGFSIKDKGYAIGGPDCFAGVSKQSLQYDPLTDSWSFLSDFPGIAISGAAGFSIGDLGYILTGRGLGNNTMSTELWELNPITNLWTKKADLPGAGRCLAFSFSIGNKGYVGTGWDQNFARLNDFWEWDQATNVWTQKADFLGGNRAQGVGFSIGNKGFAGLGSTDESSCSKDFYEYDPLTNKWIKIADYLGGCGSQQSSFSICDKGYVGSGLYESPYGFFEYEPITNTWKKMSNIGGPARKGAFAFAINKKGYVGTGAGANSCLNDFWEFSATKDYNCNFVGITEYPKIESLRIHPNPFYNSTTITSSSSLKGCEFKIVDVSGKVVRNIVGISGNELKIERELLRNGVYFIYCKNSSGYLMTNKLVVIE